MTHVGNQRQQQQRMGLWCAKEGGDGGKKEENRFLFVIRKETSLPHSHCPESVSLSSFREKIPPHFFPSSPQTRERVSIFALLLIC